MPKQARLSGIKSFRCYTREEAADVTGVSIRTIHNWEKDGLRVMDSARPALIRGDDLIAYIKRKRQARKVKTGFDEFYCCGCGKARKAAERFAECIVVDNRATLRAFCAHCETEVSKPIAKASIPDFAQVFDLTITKQQATL